MTNIQISNYTYITKNKPQLHIKYPNKASTRKKLNRTETTYLQTKLQIKSTTKYTTIKLPSCTNQYQ